MKTREEVIAELKKHINLNRALGLVRGSLYAKDMTDFNKEGLIKNLEEVEKILTEFLGESESV